MTVIEDNKYYKIGYSTQKNRAYLTIRGFWPKPESVPSYLEHWKTTVAPLTRGFTVLTDASEMATHPAAVGELHVQAQKIIIDAGVRKVGEIIKNVIAEMQLDAVAKKQAFPKKSFTSVVEAESWLNDQ